MTIAGFPALTPSTPRREAVRALLAGLAAGLGGGLWILAEATTPAPVGPLAAFTLPAATIMPRAWALDHAAWTGWASLPGWVAGAGLPWAVRLVALALIALAALAVIHPGAFTRPSPYYLSPFRRAVAYTSAALIGIAMPATALRLGAALTPDLVLRGTIDVAAAVRMAVGVALFCACVWTMAGPGILNVRAALRFSHGALAGLSIWATLALAVLFTAPLGEVAELASVGNVSVAVDVGHGAPGNSYGWMLLATMLIYGLSLGLGGAVAVSSSPQSMGARPRAGSAATGAVFFAALCLVSWRAAGQARARVAEAAPNLVERYGLSITAPPRPVLLLMGDAHATRRVPARQALRPATLAQDCAPATAAGDRALPAASEANLARLTLERRRMGGEVSGRAARTLGCEVALLARLFRPQDALERIFADSAPARVGFFAFYTAVRGLVEHPTSRRSHRWLAALIDSTRYVVSPEGHDRLYRLTDRGPADSATAVSGRLDAVAPAQWRVGLVIGADPASGVDPWLYAPRTDGQVLQYMVAATAPQADGRFRFSGIAPTWYQLALLAPEGTTPESLAALSVQGDPGQFIVAAANRRDLGTIRIRP